MADHLEVGAGVYKVQIFVPRGAGLDGVEGAEQAGIGEGVVQRDITGGALEMAVAGVMAFEERVEDQSGRWRAGEHEFHCHRGMERGRGAGQGNLTENAMNGRMGPTATDGRIGS